MRYYRILLFSSMILIFACSNNRNNSASRERESRDSIYSSGILGKAREDINETKNGNIFSVRDSTKYSPKFIKELREFASMYPSLELVEDKIIYKHKEFIEGKDTLLKDTALIPSLLPLNTIVKYGFENKNNKCELILKRIGFTDIEYELKNNEKTIKKGLATLLCSFIAAVEFVNDEKGIEYGIYEYYDRGECDTDIGLEVRTGERVYFRVSCTDVTKNISYIPVMRKE